MRHSPSHAVSDAAIVRGLVAENPWATIVSHTDEGLVASHYPVLLEEREDRLSIVTHVGRPDEEIHRLGTREVMVIVAGPHGYISPSWYSQQARAIPTWNFAVAHCYGTPEILHADENLRVLSTLVEHFERHVQDPVALDLQLGARVAAGTVGVRIEITRFVCKLKMSQDKDEQTQTQVLEALLAPGPYGNPALAEQMRRALDTAARSDSQ